MITSSLIAPCGMNCGLCIAYLRSEKKCHGCNSLSESKSLHCIQCSIKNCSALKESKSKYCFSCGRYPCQRLRDLDKRYRTKYGMSMIENLNNIKSGGIRNFVRDEKIRWTCPVCQNTICVHREDCIHCGTKRIKGN